MATALASANGKGAVSIADGTIKRLDLVRTVVLFFGRPAPDTAAASDQFESIDATFSLARQIFRADTFSMHSRDADITGTATLVSRHPERTRRNRGPEAFRGAVCTGGHGSDPFHTRAEPGGPAGQAWRFAGAASHHHQRRGCSSTWHPERDWRATEGAIRK